MDNRTDLESHRFRLNEISSDKLPKLKSLLETLQREQPAVVGVTVFGSQVTGKATPSSDIDGYLFVDEDKLGVRSDDESATILPGEGDLVAEHVDQVIGHKFRSRLNRELNLPYIDALQMRIRLLSKKRIDNELNELIRFGREETAYKGVPQEFPKSPQNLNLNILFHMQLARGLDPYRSYVLRRLETEGLAGDVGWKHLIMSTELMERYQKTTKDPKRYPQDTNTAIARFHLQKVTPAYSLS